MTPHSCSKLAKSSLRYTRNFQQLSSIASTTPLSSAATISTTSNCHHFCISSPGITKNINQARFISYKLHHEKLSQQQQQQGSISISPFQHQQQRSYSVLRSLSNTVSNALSALKSRSARISPKDLDQALKTIEEALLEADVSAPIVKKFIEDCKIDYAGLKTERTMPPSAAVYGKIKQRLILYLGGSELPSINDKTILMVGTQGSGKTTTASKLAFKLKNEDLKVLTVSLDTTRPAAMKQLKIMSDKAGVDFFDKCLEMTDPVEIAKEVVKYRDEHEYDSLIVDTAGRMHVDSSLMQELEQVANVVHPTETLLVADAMLGNDSVKIGREFSDKMGIDGIIMSRFDSNARGGATISMRYVTGVPIKYVGIGEGVQDLDMFIPKLAASRILGEGEIDNLATQFMDAHSSLDKRDFKKEPFTMGDFINYMDRLNRGSFVQDMANAIVSKLGKKVDDDKMEQGIEQMKSDLETYRIIYSEMQPDERKNPLLLKVSSSRRMRLQKRTEIPLKKIQQCIQVYQSMKQEFAAQGDKKVSFQDFKEEMRSFMDRVGGLAASRSRPRRMSLRR